MPALGRALVGALAATALCGLVSIGLAGSASANPTIVVDVQTGAVLQQEDATRPWYPASLSKLMTLYTVLKEMRDNGIDGGMPIAISKMAAKQAPSKMGYPAGTLVTLDDAIKMLVVHSANDIAWALAEGIGGSVDNFAVEMNANAAALGMRESRWYNPNGLPDARQVSSARDMAILARAIITQFPDAAALFKIDAIQSGKQIMRTHNALLYRYAGTDGMKTGFTCAAGFNVVASVTRGNRRLITVIMGAPTAKERSEEAVNLFEANFSNSGATGGFWGGGSAATPESLQASAEAGPEDMHGIACNRKRGGSAAAESEDIAEATNPAPLAPGRNDGPLAALLGMPGATAAGVPAAAAENPAEGLLATSWQLDPPIIVGPYHGPRKPGMPAAAIAATKPAAQPGAIPAMGYADPTPKPEVLPTEPAQASVAGQPLQLQGGGEAVPMGAIRLGTGPTGPEPTLPGQIPRNGVNPLTNLASDPLPPAPHPVKPTIKSGFGKPTPGKTVFSKPATGKPTLGKPGPGKLVAGKPVLTKPMLTKPAPGKLTVGKSVKPEPSQAAAIGKPGAKKPKLPPKPKSAAN